MPTFRILPEGVLKGAVLVVLLGLLVYAFSPYVPLGLNSVILGFLFAVVLGNLIRFPESLKPGMSFSGSKMLEWSIIMLAFEIPVTAITETGGLPILLIFIGLSLVLLLTVWLSRLLKCPGNTGLLTGFGTAICGSSAIAAAAPGLKGNKEDAGIAIAVVNLMGALGMLALPAILSMFSLSDEKQGFLIGGTLHAVANVAGAGYAISDSVGSAAITVKMIRVAFLSPMVILFGFLANRNPEKSWRQQLKLPPYLWAFLAIVIFTSLVELPEWFLELTKTAGKVLLTTAMVAIGLQLSFKKLYLSGRSALLFGVIMFTVQVLVFLAIMPFW